MKISVLMAVYNNKKFLAESIGSILNQTYKNFELLVQDDGSVEDIWEVINKFDDKRIKKFKNDKNIGIPGTLNKLLDNSSGDCFIRQDSDDVSLSKKFEKEINLMKKGFDFVITRAKKINMLGEVFRDSWIDGINKANSEQIKKDIVNNCYIVCGTAMWTRKVFDKIGYFDPEMIIAQDYNYWLRVLRYFDVGIVDEVLFYHRKHPGSHRTLRGRTINYLKYSQDRARFYPIIKDPNNG